MTESCTKCEAVFQSQYYLRAHMRTAHKTRFSCKHCNKRLKSQTDLEYHVTRVHLKVKRKCELCDFESYKEEVISRHVSQKHSPDKWICQICEKTFKAESQLLRHDRSIHMVVKYPCLDCDYVGSKKIYLTLHINNIHSKDKRKYDCNLCGRKFSDHQIGVERKVYKLVD